MGVNRNRMTEVKCKILKDERRITTPKDERRITTPKDERRITTPKDDGGYKQRSDIGFWNGNKSTNKTSVLMVY